MNDDFAKACKNFKEIMKEWHFVHNLLDGVPSEFITTIADLKKNNPACKFGHAGQEWFVDKIFGLPETDIIEFLGPAATAEQSHGLNMDEVKWLLTAIVKDIHEAPIDEGDPRPVPVDKLDFSKLSNHWRSFIRAGSPNATHVEKYFNNHNNPELGKKVAKVFRDKYEALKLQGLSPDAIMSELYVQTVGNGVASVERQIAAQAVLAHLFDSCDILKSDRRQRAPHDSSQQAPVGRTRSGRCRLRNPAAA